MARIRLYHTFLLVWYTHIFWSLIPFFFYTTFYFQQISLPTVQVKRNITWYNFFCVCCTPLIRNWTHVITFINTLCGQKSLDTWPQHSYVLFEHVQYTWVLQLSSWQTMTSWILFCARCHAGTGLYYLVRVKENYNATAYRDILIQLCACNFGAAVWGKDHVWVWCPQIFGPIVYLARFIPSSSLVSPR